MKKEIILASLILLIPSIVYAVNLQIQTIVPFPSNMTGGNTYTSQVNVKNNFTRVVPIYLISYINETTPIDPLEYNLTAYFSDFNFTCNQIYPGYWECRNSTNYYYFPSLSQKLLNLSLSLHPAIIPTVFNYTLEVLGPYLDDIPPIITLIAPPNGSHILPKTWINLTVEDNINVSHVWYTRSIFYDTFSASGGTTPDNPWIFSDGTWSVVNGELTQNGSITQTYAFAGDTSWTNYILESRLKASSSNADTYVGVNFRVQSDNRSYWVGIHNDNSIEVWRLDVYPGGWTQLSDWNGYTFDLSWHTIKVRAVGNNFDIYWDGDYVGSFVDSTYSSGKIGLHTAYSTFVTAQFDNVKVSTIESTLFSGSVNFTQVSIDTTSWPDGLTLIDVYANDTSDNLNHTVYFFTFDSTGPKITFVYPTPVNQTKGTGNTVLINTTVQNGFSPISWCKLEWNGVNTTMTKVGTGSSVICKKSRTTVDGKNYTYKVYAADTLGNQGVSETRIYYENSEPTLISIIVNKTCVKLNDPINVTTFNASDSDGDTLILRLGSSSNSSDLCNSTSGQPELSCIFNINWNDTSSHLIYGVVDDGLEFSAERSVAISSDNSGPIPPTGLSPINNSITNSNPTFSWSNTTDVGCNGTVNKYQISIYLNPGCAVQYKTAQTTLNSYTFPSPFSNGTYYWKVRARDGFNNWGNWSGCMKLNVDAIPPRVENSTVNTTVELGQNVTVTVDVEDDSLHTVDTVLVEEYREKYKFDFGNGTSPVENNYTNITRFMTYNVSIGYGWVSSPSGDRDRGVGTNLTRDLIFDSVNRTFNVDLSNGKYFVTVLLGDMSYPHDMMDVYVEDQLKLNDINTSAGEIKWLNFTVNVNDSQLNIKFVDDGGTDPNWVSEGLIIKSFVQSYKMIEITPMSTYSATIPYPSLGLHSIRYVANDTVGNVNDTVVDSFNVITPPPAKITSVTIKPSVIFNNTIYVGNGNTRFNITFDKNMNMSVQPTVKFGLTPIIIDDGDPGYSETGSWTSSSEPGYGNDIRYISAGSGSNNATWTPNITTAGSYRVYVSWTTHPNRATNANYTIYYNGGSYSFTVNQENYANGSTGGSSGEWSGWYYADTFNFSAGANGKVVLNDNANEYVIADAVKFESTKTNLVTGTWTNSTLWSGIYFITNTTGDGNNTLNITGAKDSIGRIVEENTSTWFMIGTAPKFATLIISPSIGNTYVKAGNISFTIIFGQPMNMSVNPTVTFGQSSLFNTYAINGSWNTSTNTTWVGYYNVLSSMSNVWYTISISGAQDFMGSVIPQDTSYRFLVDTRPPRIWDIQISNITTEENETISVRVKDDKSIGQESSGIGTVLVELNGSINFTMQFGYLNTFMASGDSVYYFILNNSSYAVGNQSLKFYVNDTAGNVNSNATASFYVNSTIPQIGGKIAFLCRNNPVNGTSINGTCNDDIEPQLISWLRSQGWNVTVNIYYKWNKANLAGYNLMMCSDERYACDYATKSTTDVYYMHKVNKTAFVEISDDSLLRAAKNFAYVRYSGGSTRLNINNLYVTIGHPITTGYFGNMQIFSTNKNMTTISDDMLSGVKDIADAGAENHKTTLFSKDQPGRFVYVGWFYRDFSGLNAIGNTTLTRAISWAQCGNAKGCS